MALPFAQPTRISFRAHNTFDPACRTNDSKIHVLFPNASMVFPKQTHFNYDSLDKSNDSFRLCKLLPEESGTPIQCEHDQISSYAGLYCAISYTWGNHSEKRWIRLNGQPFMVQANLLAALKAIRRVDTELLIWIDAICIYVDRHLRKDCGNLRFRPLFSEGFRFAASSVRLIFSLLPSTSLVRLHRLDLHVSLL